MLSVVFMNYDPLLMMELPNSVKSSLKKVSFTLINYNFKNSPYILMH